MSASLYLAPIRGITDAIYRQTFMRYFGGFDCAVAPFLTTFHGATIKATHLTDLLPENNTLLPVIPQILSKNPDNFIGVAQELYDLVDNFNRELNENAQIKRPEDAKEKYDNFLKKGKSFENDRKYHRIKHLNYVRQPDKVAKQKGV